MAFKFDKENNTVHIPETWKEMAKSILAELEKLETDLSEEHIISREKLEMIIKTDSLEGLSLDDIISIGNVARQICFNYLRYNEFDGS